MTHRSYLHLLQSLLKDKKAQGFTLIELLVVIIIIGILAAIAIPNLMSQIGKAREGEAKSIIGALNRAQQSYFVENGVFSPHSDPKDGLDVPIGKTLYYDTVAVVPNVGVQYAHNNDNDQNNTRDFVGAVQYSESQRSYQGVLCRANKGITVTNDTEATNQLNGNYGVQSTVVTLGCGATSTEIR